MVSQGKIVLTAFIFLFFAGVAFADVDRVSGTLLAVVNLIKEASPVITMTCLILGAIMYSSCGLISVGSEMHKQFVMAAQGLLTISVVALTLGVVTPPVVGVIYGLPPNSCVYGCGVATCNIRSAVSGGMPVCCADATPYFCGGGTGSCRRNPC